MPINLQQALAAKLPSSEFTYDEDRVILYHLGLGAGNPPTDPGELAYTYEGRLKVLPTFSVIPVYGMLISIFDVPGLEFNPALILHGEQEIEVFAPIPTAASVHNDARIAAIYDKAKAAVLVLESTTTDQKGNKLFVNRFSLFLRGEGGFGGEPGPRISNDPPDREPDKIVEFTTLPQQALIFRLSGDKNPLHADPDFAAIGGFDKPILHGLCSYGIACRSVVDHLLDGDVTKIRRYQCRFRGVIFPGETLVTSMWREGNQVFLKSNCKDRGTAVISHGVIDLG
jgi:acyl dehydratase